MRHVIRAMRRHDLANKKTKTKTMTMTNAFREHPERAIFETMTKTKTMTITNTFREHQQKTIL